MSATILITGGAGTLATALAPMLIERGDQVRLVDIVPTTAPKGAEAHVADIRDPMAVGDSMKGVDAVVHAAAWHGIHMREHPAQDFFDLNVAGTFNVYQAAASAGVRRAVLASTMGVYGRSRRPGSDGHAVRVHEELPLQPDEIYGTSKLLAEELATYYDRAGEIRGVALRFGMFVPEPFLHTGIRFLYGGVDQADVARAVIAALDRLATAEPGQFTAFNIESALPYDDADGAQLRDDPLDALARHWPDAPPLLEAAGIAPWGPINEWFDIGKARAALGWSPQRNFDDFLSALRAGAVDWPET